MIFEGALAVKAAILNDKRDVECVYIDQAKKDRDTAFIMKVARQKAIEVKRVARRDIDALASGKSHGGIIASVGKRRYQTLDLKAREIFVIDGIEDPYNLGYIFRTLIAFGYPNVIMPDRDLLNMEATIIKSSAGAFDMIDIYMSADLVTDLKEYSDHELVALSRSQRAKDLFAHDFARPSIVILGGEKRGIKKDVLAMVDTELFIPYHSDFRPALNASSALACIVTAMRAKQ